MKNNKVIYTALFGKYDYLEEPEVFDGWDYICFTDQKDLKSSIWDIIVIENNAYQLNELNRLYKWLPHKFLKNYDTSLYIDTNISINKNPDSLVKKYLNESFIAIPYHPSDCIYNESKACVLLGKSNIENTFEQMKKYREKGFPQNFGLSENSIIFRKHNDGKVIELMENVFNNFNVNKTKRDQLSLFYEIWKLNFKEYVLMEERIDNSEYFARKTHRYKIEKTIWDRLLGKYKKLTYRYEAKIYNEKLDNLLKDT